MKEKKSGSTVVNTTQCVSCLNGVKQVVDIDNSDLKNISEKGVNSMASNMSFNVQLKQSNKP
ncbi:hypothetical protein P3584_22170 [Vibrio parahaemolyticus]|uniref:hypothetical protein n=1 Tax=Vibrio campbellii TaxID=680 RepID=UPI000A2FEE76|nr:hypothetical protein [Vibrio campbellii]ARR48109.1 hypothetical protein CAY59_28285 [Vibrio campbellii]MDF4896485.1 hypothetical protein [Vibrio parahaemolyticus]